MDGLPAQVTWRDGVIEGTPLALSRIDVLISLEEVVLEVCPSTWRAALTPSWVALPTIRAVFGKGARVRGRAADPPWFDDPPGTVY